MSFLNSGTESSQNGFRWGVFALGLILLVMTFFATFMIFRNPAVLEAFSKLIPIVNVQEGPLMMNNIFKVITYAIAVLLLWVMGSISGRIAKHGINNS